MTELDAIHERGYVILEGLLDGGELAELRAALRPHLQDHGVGRNNFEGYATERVYALVGKGAAFARLAEHPRVLALCDALLEPNYLLTASQAIRIYPGETPQPWHVDDGFYRIPRPRPPVSISTIWAIDPFTSDNGATQLVPGSHAWADAPLEQLVAELAREIAERHADRTPRRAATPSAFANLVVDATMAAGSVIVFAGTLLHRGGENRSRAPRLAISHQYCQPWARQQENFTLAVPREQARALSPRVQAMLGYSIHPPFMGHVGGVHPARLLVSPDGA
jgi:ectoine hydroxylase-related dioxygenase (phytanoyl-CoA dioxygenase family)